MKIRLGHSPDSDDAFMFWGLASGEVKSEHEFEHILRDIQTLNEWAREGKLESSAVSVHAFAYVADKYALLRHGGSFGEGYGPMVVAKRQIPLDELRETKIAVPGVLTSAFLQLNLWFDDVYGASPVAAMSSPANASPSDPSKATTGRPPGDHPATPVYGVVPFDQIIPAIQSGEYDAGLIIHEGQLTYEKEGLVEIANMGKWWAARTGGLPLPLGVNVVRKDLGAAICADVSRCMRESIDAGLNNRDKALEYALQFARDMDRETSDEFVGMYVNERTRDMGDDGVRAIRLLLSEGARIGLVPKVEVEVVD
ncbi:MAG: MqnA/MqnD/SBP family protein [Fimbriimonadaceae bacterium]